MGDGTKESPFAREDILRLIEENGGTAKGLDLSGKVFERGIDLSGLDLIGIILNKAWFPWEWDGAVQGAKLQGARLHLAQLQEADLMGAYLQGAALSQANLEGADLVEARLEGSFLTGVKLSTDTKLEFANWGSYILAEEESHAPILAQRVYRELRMWYGNAGKYDIAGEFFFREMTVKRKMLKWWPNPFARAWSKFISLICGYGERPLRVVVWGISVLFGLALLYFFLRGVAPYTLTVQAFLGSLYYSAVSFTALGYGPWFSAISIRSWVQGVGAAEAILGVFTMALFLITFVRKMTR